jgi:hypothetical protein
MRKWVLQFLILFFVNTGVVISQAEIDLTYDNLWGPDRYNKVSCQITLDRSDGFLRFTQNFPSGFQVIKDNIPGGDFSWTGKQLNIVWMKLPPGREIRFSFYVRPGKSLSGSKVVTGKIIQVTDDVGKQTIPVKDIRVTVGGTNGILPGELKVSEPDRMQTNITDKEELVSDSNATKIIFRVQVSTSSVKKPVEEIRKNMGIDLTEKMAVVKTGQVYKYQAGEFDDYESAKLLLTRLQGKGIRDAFIVAFRGNEQILVDQALRDIERRK